ncbi:hypothetical protein [Actinocrispum sp. NPDC049592]|uniref:hypothetical protein n=1 Tax=Actinocrispum sp. NPDC049592 TaxID=3154835 RepID=UPI003439CF83
MRSGHEEAPVEFDGNAWVAVLTPEGVELENQFTDTLPGAAPLDRTLSMLRSYWDALGEQALDAGRKYFVRCEGRDPVLPW